MADIICAQHIILIAQELNVDMRVNIYYKSADGPRYGYINAGIICLQDYNGLMELCIVVQRRAYNIDR